MPSRDLVEAYIAKVVGGDFVGVIAEFYREDASIREPGRAPRYGREILMEYVRRSVKRFARVEAHRPLAVLVDGDQTAVHWVFEAAGHDGAIRRLELLNLQRWVGNRIAEERVFYDDAAPWRMETPVG